MSPETEDALKRAEAACELFVTTKLSAYEKTLFREYHRIAFLAGFMMAELQQEWRKEKK